MRRLFEADMNRIAAKVFPWFFLACAYAYLVIRLTIDIDGSPDRDFFFFEQVVMNYQWVLTIVGFAALIGIYADEYKSMSMIAVIGSGISREKFVFTKFMDLCFLTFQMEALFVIYVIILKVAFGVRLTPVETRYLILMFVLYYLETLSYVVLAAIFYFLSENAAVGMFAYLVFDMIIPVMLMLVVTMSKFGKYHPERYYVSGMISAAFSDFIMGDFGEGVLFVLLALAIYVFCALGITILIFKRKELEF